MNAELSRKHSREGDPVPLNVSVRAAVKKCLERIAIREERNLDYVVDEILRWAVEEYRIRGTLRELVESVTMISSANRKSNREELEELEALLNGGSSGE